MTAQETTAAFYAEWGAMRAHFNAQRTDVCFFCGKNPPWRRLTGVTIGTCQQCDGPDIQ